MSAIPIDHWPSRLNTDPWFDHWWMTRPPRFSRPSFFSSSFEDIEREIEQHRREIEREFERHHQDFLARTRSSRSGIDFDFPPMPAMPPMPRIPFDDQYAPKVTGDGRVAIDITLPDHVDPSKVNVSCKDREIIIKAEDRQDRADGHSSFSFYQRSTLPPETDLNQMRATINNNRLSITAPVTNNGLRSTFKQIPIESNNRRPINY